MEQIRSADPGPAADAIASRHRYDLVGGEAMRRIVEAAGAAAEPPPPHVRTRAGDPLNVDPSRPAFRDGPVVTFRAESSSAEGA